MNILITGATGLVGRAVGIKLVEMGHNLIVFSRKKNGLHALLPYPCKICTWDLHTGKYEDPGQVDAILNLAGSPIGEARWTESVKNEVLQSRILATKLVSEIAKIKKSKVVVNASAIGFYGDRADQWLEESSNPGAGFLSETCQAWEKALFDSSFTGRKCVLRIGIVLSRAGGVLGRILPIFLNGAGGVLGNGRQYMSWIHLEDLVTLICESIQNERYQGAINAVAPSPVTNMEFTKTVSEAVGVPAIIPAPAFALKIVLGEMSQLVLGSQRVRSAKLTELGFQFEFNRLNEAIFEQLSPYRDGVRLVEENQYIAHPIEKVWPFFSSETNLENITPDSLKFQVLRKSTNEIRLGTLIDYKLKIHGVPSHWQTEIAEWNPPYQFVDMQKKGPYSLWHHTHSFQKLGKGTLMRDLVRYKLPMGLLGRTVAGAYVASDVKKIFAYRRQKMEEYFPSASN